MFEKEAEERVRDYIIKNRDCLMQPCKTLEDCKNQELEFDEGVKLFKDGAEFGYNKANEWHYVKDGDLPPLDTNVLVIHRWARTPEVGKRIKVFINSSVWVWAMCSDRFRYTSDDKNVIAWCEIPTFDKEI